MPRRNNNGLGRSNKGRNRNNQKDNRPASQRIFGPPRGQTESIVKRELAKIRRLEIKEKNIQNRALQKAKAAAKKEINSKPMNYKDPRFEDINVPWWQSALGVAGDIALKAAPFIMGLGDYTVEDGPIQTNSIVASMTDGKVGSQVPEMRNDNGRHQTHHREYLGDVLSSTGWSSTTYPINPGLSNSFPWLAPIANQYQCYKMKGMCVEFISLSSQYTTNTYLGFVAMAPIYNVSQVIPTDKRELENTSGSVSSKPTKSMLLGIECAPNRLPLKEYFVRGGDLAPNQDIKFYDLANLVVAVGGQPTSGAILGELWFSYDIEFFDPIALASSINPNLETAHFYGSGQSAGSPFSTLLKDIDTIGVVIGTNTLTFTNVDDGLYYIEIIMTGGAVTLNYAAPTVTNGTAQAFTQNNAVNNGNLPPSGTAGSTGMHMSYLIKITPGTTMIFTTNFTTIPTSFIDVLIFEVNSSFPRPMLGENLEKLRESIGCVLSLPMQKYFKKKGLYDDRKTLQIKDSDLVHSKKILTSCLDDSDCTASSGEDNTDLKLQLIMIYAQLSGRVDLANIKKKLEENDWDVGLCCYEDGINSFSKMPSMPAQAASAAFTPIAFLPQMHNPLSKKKSGNNFSSESQG